MANTKRYTVAYNPPAPGSEPVIAIQRDSDGFFWEDGVGFAAPLVDNAMVQDFFGFWTYETNFEAFDNGLYNILIRANGGDPLLGYSQTMSNDVQIGFIEASGITAKNAVSSIKSALQPIQAQLTSQATQLGVLADRIDSLNQILSRRDYNSTGP